MNNIYEAPIGVFDSGVGGLTVAREIMRNIPAERIVYFGDTARVPYGSKSKGTVLRYSRQIIRFLRTRQVKAIVVACNTASAYALEEIQKELDIPIIGVVKPGARVACQATRNGRIGVIATDATINTGIYTEFIRNQDQGIQVIGKACPLFVPLVEEGWLEDPVTMQIAGRYLQELKDSDIDTLILGCTHYPLLRSTVGKIMGSQVRLVNPAYETALELKRLLKREGIANPGKRQDEAPYGHYGCPKSMDIDEAPNGYYGCPKNMDKKDEAPNGHYGCPKNVDKKDEDKHYQFYVSDASDKFKQVANSILPYDIETTKQINIEEY